MNYLAHFHLAFKDEDLLVGQFLGDSIKGKNYSQYPEKIGLGITLHRFIDSQTDLDPSCRELRAFLRPDFGIHSSIIIDLLLDHVLANQWAHYSAVSLETFAVSTYNTLKKNVRWLDEETKRLLFYMEKYNWLLAYQDVEGMRRSFHGLGTRVSGGEAIKKAGDQLERLIPSAIACFESYFPRLIDECAHKINTFARIGEK